MGNFYTNFTLLGADVEEALAAATELKRTVFAVQGAPGITVLYDERCDEQDPGEIETLGRTLSAKLSAPVLACLNHDDDDLLLWLFAEGEIRAKYDSCLSAPAFAWSLSRIRGGLLGYPLIMGVLGWPIVLLQVYRHKSLTNLLSLPPAAVGFGFTYLARGEIPEGVAQDELKKN